MFVETQTDTKCRRCGIQTKEVVMYFDKTNELRFYCDDCFIIVWLDDL